MKGDEPMMMKDLKTNLLAVWGVNEGAWQIIPMGKGYFMLNMKSDKLKSHDFARGTVYLKPGVFRISQWVHNFNPNNQRQSNL